MSQALIDLGISHEEFITILHEKESNTKMKEDRALKSSHELNKEEGVKKLN